MVCGPFSNIYTDKLIHVHAYIYIYVRYVFVFFSYNYSSYVCTFHMRLIFLFLQKLMKTFFSSNFKFIHRAEQRDREKQKQKEKKFQINS